MTKSQKIIITGINGFVGEHLARHLHEASYHVSGVGRELIPNDRVAPFLDSYQKCDLLDSESVKTLILKDAKAIIHLAGLASVADSFNNPELYTEGNAKMTNNLFTVAESQDFSGRVVAVSTGALYSPAQPMPLNESSEIVAGSPYATGKIKAEKVVTDHKKNGLDVVIARPFNHIGPGQGVGFLIPDLYEQLETARIEGSSKITIGNLTTKRDYTDVRDIAAAYTLLATKPELQYGVYNIASGRSYSGLEILDILKDAMELDHIETVVDESRFRPSDAPDIIGDATRLNQELGWQPKSSVDQAIGDFVNEKLST